MVGIYCVGGDVSESRSEDSFFFFLRDTPQRDCARTFLRDRKATSQGSEQR